MMPLQSLVAKSHPDGNRIDLSWKIPVMANYSGVRVVRKQRTYPVSPDDGVMVVEADGLESFSDTGLQAEHTYYYMLFPYIGDPPSFDIEIKNRVAALASANHGYADYMYANLPSIYHRYDKNSTQLQRFLQITGGQLDQLHSLAASMQQLQNTNEVNGHLLPLLAKWIGWKTDHKFEFSRQREEIQNAPSIYQAVEIIPVVEATVKRISGWESRSKEFVYNVFASNQMPRLNLWSSLRDSGGNWSEVQPLSLDYAYEGRASSCIDDNDVQWFFYHTQRKGCWEIWYKTSPQYALDLQYQQYLLAGDIEETLWLAMLDLGIDVSMAALLAGSGNHWEISDGPRDYRLEVQSDVIIIYDVSAAPGLLSGSQPIVASQHQDTLYKYPSAVQLLQTLWLFWSMYDQQTGLWQIQYRTREAGIWSAIEIFNGGNECRYPNAMVDQDDRLWLFWQEKVNLNWRFRYSRFDAGVWQLAVDMPLDGGVDPRINADISVMFLPSVTDPRIFVFWSRYANTSTPGQKRWEVAYRVKEDLVLDAANWTAVNILPKDGVSDNHHDREAWAIPHDNGIEVFCSSNRDNSGWSIWRLLLTDYSTNTWDAAETQRLSEAVYSQRNPFAMLLGDSVWLSYRSGTHLQYKSGVYRASTTFNERYEGSSTIDIRHTQKNELQAEFEDVLRYTYDVGRAEYEDGERDNEDRIARDTVGVYLDNATVAEDELENGIARLAPALKEFMPLTDRAVFIADNTLHTEYVYSYDLPASSDSHYINSTYQDELVSVLEENALGPSEDFLDSLES